jgi:hypothetical protein
VDPGDRFTFYKLVDSVIPSTLGKDGHEKSFFDGIDTSLPGAGWQGKKSLELRKQLEEIAKLVAQAANDAKGNDGSVAIPPLMGIVAGLKRVSEEVRAGVSGTATTKADLLTRIAEKQQQAETALNLALGVKSYLQSSPLMMFERQPSRKKRSTDCGFSGTRVRGSCDISQRLETCRAD